MMFVGTFYLSILFIVSCKSIANHLPRLSSRRTLFIFQFSRQPLPQSTLINNLTYVNRFTPDLQSGLSTSSICDVKQNLDTQSP